MVDVVSFCVAVNCARRNLSESVGNELENCSLPSMVIVVSLYCDSPQKHWLLSQLCVYNVTAPPLVPPSPPFPLFAHISLGDDNLCNERMGEQSEKRNQTTSEWLLMRAETPLDRKQHRSSKCSHMSLTTNWAVGCPFFLLQTSFCSYSAAIAAVQLLSAQIPDSARLIWMLLHRSPMLHNGGSFISISTIE